MWRNEGKQPATLILRVVVPPGGAVDLIVPPGDTVELSPDAVTARWDQPPPASAARVDLLIAMLGETGWSLWPMVRDRLLSRHQSLGGARTADRLLRAAVGLGWVQASRVGGLADASGWAGQIVALTAAGRDRFQEQQGRVAVASEWDRFAAHCGGALPRLYLYLMGRFALQTAGYAETADPAVYVADDGRRAHLQGCLESGDLDRGVSESVRYVLCANKRVRLDIQERLWDWAERTEGVAHTATLRELRLHSYNWTATVGHVR